MKKPKVSIQGLAGSFHDDAARKYFGPDTERIHREEFDHVFDDIKTKKADFAVVAYKNAQYGPIYEVEGLLRKHRSKIIGEVTIEVSFYLLGTQDSSLESINQVYSQKPALIQCRSFLEYELADAELIDYYDTAGAAADVAQWKDGSKAALASKTCADIYGLNILAEAVEDAPGRNETQFYVLAAS